MTSREFIEQQIKAGYSLHFNKGIWWQKTAPFFYKPAIHFEMVDPGRSRPAASKALLGYSHLVDAPEKGNKCWQVMMMGSEKLREFSISSISSSKRARVRKGLKMTAVKVIEDIEPVLNDLKGICISAAKRTRHGKSPEYYDKHYDEWRSWIVREHSLANREWWGAYDQDSLIAYLYSVLIDDTMFIYTAKSHTDFLDRCPNDALVFSFLQYCKTLNECQKVVFGDWSSDVPSLNEFKERHGFEKTEKYVYARYNPLIVPIKKALRKQ